MGTTTGTVSTATDYEAVSRLRYPKNLEGNIFECLSLGGYLAGKPSCSNFEQRINAWVMRGAIREDDNDVGVYPIGDRDDHPCNTVFRAGRHFYDLINNCVLDSGLTCINFECKVAINLSIARSGVLVGAGTIDGPRENHFSWQDTRNSYWASLTFGKPSTNSTMV